MPSQYRQPVRLLTQKIRNRLCKAFIPRREWNSFVSRLISNLGLYSDHLLGRDRYLARLNSRILSFKGTAPRVSGRAIDGSPAGGRGGDFRVPEIAASDLTGAFLKKSMREHGCIIVRDFFDDNEVRTMRSYVDYAFRVKDDGFLSRYLLKECDLQPVLKETSRNIKEKRKSNPTYTDSFKKGAGLARFIGHSESRLTVRTPNIAEKLLRLYEKKALKDLLENYFGSEPCISVKKWNLRKSRPPAAPIDFHQDGAFMGDEIDSLNCWIPLSDCGAGYDVQGIDIVPLRLMHVFPPGSGVLDLTVAASAIIEKYSEKAIVTPTFRKGDLIFFDHLLLHRTQSLPNATENRYAIETWFFDSVNFPKNQIPLKW